jgi:hypothetical protein
MHVQRRVAAVLWNLVLVLCVVALIVSLVALGAGLFAVIAIIAAYLVFFVLPFRAQNHSAVVVRRTHRFPPARAPPTD